LCAYFENRGSGVSATVEGAGGIDNADMRHWERQFAAMTDEFRLTLRVYAQADDTVAVRASLRQYIDMLEELYSGI